MNKIMSVVFRYTFHFKILVLFLFLVSCKNSSKEINDFLADKNLPIGVTENINYVYKDSGRVTSKMIAPLYWDFTNRKLNPYSEFPKGVKIVRINSHNRDSITIIGDYAISYENTNISEIIGNVVVVNHNEGVTLNTDQMYWDQKEGYYFTQNPFEISTDTDTITGVGFESRSDLSNWILNETKGDFVVDKKEK